MIEKVDANKAQEQKKKRILTGMGLLALLFLYSVVGGYLAGLDGIISGALLSAVASGYLLSVIRKSQLKVVPVTLDAKASDFIEEAIKQNNLGEIRFLAHRLSAKDYRIREEEARIRYSIQAEEGSFIFLEVDTQDVNAGKDMIEVRGITSGDYQVCRCKCQSAPVAIASILMHIRNQTKQIPHVYLGWTDAHPLSYAWKFILFGEGETAPLTRELIRTNEPIDNMRPYIHVA